MLPLIVRVGFYLVGRAISFLVHHWKLSIAIVAISLVNRYAIQLSAEQFIDYFPDDNSSVWATHLTNVFVQFIYYLVPVFLGVALHRHFINGTFLIDNRYLSNSWQAFILYFILFVTLTIAASYLRLFTTPWAFTTTQIYVAHFEQSSLYIYWINLIRKIVFTASFHFGWSVSILSASLLFSGLSVNSSNPIRENFAFFVRRFKILVFLAISYTAVSTPISQLLDYLSLYFSMSPSVTSLVFLIYSTVLSMIITVLMSDLFVIGKRGEVKPIYMLGSRSLKFLHSIAKSTDETKS